MKKKWQFLRETTDGKLSTQRLAVFLVICAGVFDMLAVGVYILVKAFNCTEEINNWESMGIFLGGLAATVTGTMWMKQRQKKDENVKAE